ncbi:O-linked N-acetylglucosamine transferase, SPINDLY family protein, partial [Cuspidothrix issatschenkoi LEGE 03284]|uniref:tetratricopeptide repeat protein n=1 Tax=Cuspidothrix issatschenkoi TaxID=230752 RepID=UPI0019E7B848|nr:O-linked N-acetylglucosamine transferase, SPINDLY family protein [Cuspidothrix issatschenkoi LEGE 03284]
MTSTFKTQAQQCLLQRNYAEAATYYEQAITAEPEVKSHYWNLGLLLLLQGEETEARLTWMMGMNEGEGEEVEKWTIELIEILQQEAARQEILSNYKLAFVIRQHIREIIPSDLNNLLHIIRLGIKLENLTGDELTDLGIIELLPTTENLNIQLLLNTLENILNYDPVPVAALEFAEVCLSRISNFQLFYNIVAPAAIRINYSLRKTKLAILLLELCLTRYPENIEVLSYLVEFYLAILDYSKAIEIARLCCAYAKSLTDKLLSNKFLVKALLNAPTYWQE